MLKIKSKKINNELEIVKKALVNGKLWQRESVRKVVGETYPVLTNLHMKDKYFLGYVDSFASKKDLEKIEIYDMKAENDMEHSCRLKGSYQLLEYDVENYEIKGDFLKLYIISGDKVIFRGGLNYPKNSIDEEKLLYSFGRLKEYIQKINEKIEFYKNYYETIEKNK